MLVGVCITYLQSLGYLALHGMHKHETDKQCYQTTRKIQNISVILINFLMIFIFVLEMQFYICLVYWSNQLIAAIL